MKSLRILLPLLLGVTSATSYGQQPASSANQSFVERVQGRLSQSVLKTADGIDKFFGANTQSAWDDNDSYVRLRLNLDQIQDHGTNFGAQLKIHLVLPGLEGRLRLVSNDDDGVDEQQTGQDSRDDSSLALRYVGIQGTQYAVSFDLGLRIKDSDLDPYVRANAYRGYGLGESWAGRTEGRVYYYDKTGGRVDVRQYFERRLSKNIFFRSRTRAEWLDEEGSNIFPEQRFTLFQRLDNKSVLAYEALASVIPASDSAFDPDELLVTPKDKYKQAMLRLRYRRNVKWPWFFVEVWPVVAWPEQRDYDTVLAARLRFEVLFGKVSKNAHLLED